ncbi:hypothetical protein PHLCEN_2v4304 [Hermanssonia centrifuga]|uniref:Uncharacterized protein n=1 Tax=Hermanssonia centrifuga TaxID=98765 RepID=A0A2R6PVH6_9APHY|nr:hypothetical protein PHLCEN_2v4304 [Hermanssonia centrifuga]
MASPLCLPGLFKLECSSFPGDHSPSWMCSNPSAWSAWFAASSRTGTDNYGSVGDEKNSEDSRNDS